MTLGSGAVCIVGDVVGGVRREGRLVAHVVQQRGRRLHHSPGGRMGQKEAVVPFFARSMR